MKHLLFVLLIVCGAQAAQAQSKIAHANFQQLLDTLPSRKVAMAEITRVQTEGQRELIEEQQKLQKEIELLSTKELSPAMIQYEESRLMKMQQQLQKREQEISELLQLLAEESDAKSLGLIKKAVNTVAQQKGLNYVLEVSSLLYNNGTDITKDIIPVLLELDKQPKPTAAGNSGQ